MGVLGGHPQGELADGIVPAGETGPGLDGVGDEAVVAQIHLGGVSSAREGGVDLLHVAEVPVEREVAGSLGVDLGSALGEGGDHFDRTVEGLVVDLHQIGGVAGAVAVLSHHDRHPVADVMHGIDRQDRMGRLLEIGVEPAHRHHPADVAGLDVLAGKHRHHPGMGLGGGGVDRLDVDVGVGAADDHGLGHAAQRQVVGVFALAGDQRRVLPAFHGLADDAAHEAPPAARRTALTML